MRHFRKGCKHCWIWSYDPERYRTKVTCAHCGWDKMSWDSHDHDALRARMSVFHHRVLCGEYRYRYTLEKS